MQIKRIPTNNYNTNVNTQKTLTFKAKGDIIRIHGADFIDLGDHYISKLPLDNIEDTALDIMNETRKNLEILKQFKPENIKEYLLELIEYAKGNKHIYDMSTSFEKGIKHLYLTQKPLNQPVRYIETASSEMSNHLKKYRKPFVINDDEGQEWIASTHMGNYSDTAWGPVGVDVTPLEHLK